MLRRVVFGGIAGVIVIVTLVIAGLTMSSAPTFTAESGAYQVGEPGPFTIKCNAIGPGQLDDQVYIHQDDVFEGLDEKTLYAFAEAEGLKVDGDLTQAEMDETQAFFETVLENTTFYCAQLRENQQTGLLATYGTALLLLTLLSIAAVLTAPRPKPTV